MQADAKESFMNGSARKILFFTRVLLSFVSLASEKRNNSLAPQQHETSPATINLKNIIENITL
jgi:hypothetical protein